MPQDRGPVSKLGLDVETWIDAGRAVVEVGGEVDCYSVPTLREELARLPALRPLRIAVVMDHVQFLDSAGIGVLIGSAKRAQAVGGRMALVGCSAHVAGMLRMMGLDQVFALHDDLQTALEWLDGALR